jgi:hypothetical protein
MNLNEATTPAAPVKACLRKNGPITRFRADDEVYLEQFHKLAKIYGTRRPAPVSQL